MQHQESRNFENTSTVITLTYMLCGFLYSTECAFDGLPIDEDNQLLYVLIAGALRLNPSLGANQNSKCVQTVWSYLVDSKGSREDMMSDVRLTKQSLLSAAGNLCTYNGVGTKFTRMNIGGSLKSLSLAHRLHNIPCVGQNNVVVCRPMVKVKNALTDAMGVSDMVDSCTLYDFLANYTTEYMPALMEMYQRYAERRLEECENHELAEAVKLAHNVHDDDQSVECMLGHLQVYFALMKDEEMEEDDDIW